MSECRARETRRRAFSIAGESPRQESRPTSVGYRRREERLVGLGQMASLTASLMERTGPLLDVAFQAAPSERSIAASATAGRADTTRTLREFWHRIHDDGLLPPSIDLEWLTETATLIAHAEATS